MTSESLYRDLISGEKLDTPFTHFFLKTLNYHIITEFSKGQFFYGPSILINLWKIKLDAEEYACQHFQNFLITKTEPHDWLSKVYFLFYTIIIAFSFAIHISCWTMQSPVSWLVKEIIFIHCGVFTSSYTSFFNKVIKK